MKKISVLFKSFRWTLIITCAWQASGPIIAMEPEQVLSPQKQSLLRRLVADFKETRELYRKRKAGKASPEELKKIENRMKTLKKIAISTGVITAFIAAVLGIRQHAKYLAGTQKETTVMPEVPPLSPAVANTLYDAIRNKDKDRIEFLLSRGADPNVRDYYSDTPLHTAVWEGHTEIAKLLIEKGADLNSKDNIGATPLHEAVSLGHPEIAKLLIEKGADLNSKNNCGETPLHRAARLGHIEIAKLLIEKGADLEAKDFKGKTPLDIATTKEIKTLIQGEIDFRQKLARQALTEAFEESGRTVPELEAMILEQAFPEEAERRAKKGKVEIEKQRLEGEK